MARELLKYQGESYFQVGLVSNILDKEYDLGRCGAYTCHVLGSLLQHVVFVGVIGAT